MQRISEIVFTGKEHTDSPQNPRPWREEREVEYDIKQSQKIKKKVFYIVNRRYAESKLTTPMENHTSKGIWAAQIVLDGENKEIWSRIGKK